MLIIISLITNGIWGLTFYILLMPILTFVHCPSSLGSACVEHKDSFYFERPDNYFNEIAHNGILFFLCILGIVTIATFNMAGVSVTKYVSSVARFYIYIYIYINILFLDLL